MSIPTGFNFVEQIAEIHGKDANMNNFKAIVSSNSGALVRLKVYEHDSGNSFDSVEHFETLGKYWQQITIIPRT